MNSLKKNLLFILPVTSITLLFLFTNSCSNELDVLFPEWDNTPATTTLSSDQKTKMEGVYNVEQGSDQFGSTVILQWNGNYLTVYTGKNTGYFLLQGGELNTSIYIQGLWRYQNNAETGLSQFTMTEGAAYVLGNSPDSSSIVLTGTWGDGQGTPSNSVVFKYARPIKPELLQNKFYIISHHGSGGGPEYLPHTENTVEIARIIERYGCNGMEIDVRISSDGIPFMYHDNTLNPRLVLKGSLIGTVETYTYKELQSFVVLKHGERIPTLDAILTAIVTDTQLEFIYVDCKPSAINGLPAIAAVCQDARDLAETIPNRAPINIYMAMTTDDLITAFQQLPNFRDIPTICELTIDDLNTLNSEVWSPRFTEGTQNSQVEQLHAQGKLAITWTVNLPALMFNYLNEGIFDGFLTDYPTQLAFYYYGQ
ncbi:MAG: glycerophosphodiester phosphodiesterase family protein [Ignavibacteriaceae bacterium]